MFQNLNIVVRCGETIRFLGRNGTGKTTLLKVFGGVLQLTEGRIELLPGVKAAYMDQSAGEMLALSLTVREQLKVAAGGAPSGHGRTLLSSFGLALELRLDDFVGHLSGGQRQILALVTTLISGANLLCLDEFMSSLDDQSALTAGEALRQMQAQRNISLLVASHSSLPIPVSREVGIHNTGGTP